jgi:Protein of unknown function (DUF4232)
MPPRNRGTPRPRRDDWPPSETRSRSDILSVSHGWSPPLPRGSSVASTSSSPRSTAALSMILGSRPTTCPPQCRGRDHGLGPGPAGHDPGRTRTRPPLPHRARVNARRTSWGDATLSRLTWDSFCLVTRTRRRRRRTGLTRRGLPSSRLPERSFDPHRVGSVPAKMLTSRAIRRLPATVLVSVLAVTLAGCSIFSSATPTPVPSAAPSESSAASENPTPTPTATPTPTPSPTPVPTPTPTPVPPIALCTSAHLAARITAWDAGAGHRTAHVELTNAGASSCRLRALDRPQLVDGHGSVLIDGPSPATSALLTVGPGAVVKTLVDDSNYCGPAPLAPVTIAFVLPGGTARFVATPLSPTDLSGVPPCLGAPGSAGNIAMQPWAP